MLTRAARFVLYRDSGSSLTITRLQQVEHETYLTLRAGQAGAAVPEIIEAGTAGPSKAALLVAMTLSVSLRAFGDHLWLPVLIVIITLAGIIGGVSPSPGGMGVVEAGMVLGLTAAGVAESAATAEVFIQRLFTSYLPPIWGWAVLVWMRKKEYL